MEEKKKTNPTSNSGVQRKMDEIINVVALKGNGGGDSSERQQAAWEGGMEGCRRRPEPFLLLLFLCPYVYLLYSFSFSHSALAVNVVS